MDSGQLGTCDKDNHFHHGSTPHLNRGTACTNWKPPSGPLFCRCPDDALRPSPNRDIGVCTLCGGVVHLAMRR
jgi:hypothetical protein